MHASVTHFLPLTKIRRERVLPVPGRLLVHTGQKVKATDVIAETRLSNEHLLIDVATTLGLSTEQATNAIKRQVGDAVTEGDVLAGPVGLIPRVLRAPRNGTVITVAEGQILFEVEHSPYKMRAGMSGTVRAVLAEKGAILETTGALVQGVWGNGQIDEGILTTIGGSPREELVPGKILLDHRNMIVLGGYVCDLETLKEAQQVQIRGLIIASLTPNLVPAASQMPYPILILDGFGRIPMNSIAYRILSTNDQREVTVNACHWDRFSDSRPEVIIPLPATDNIEMPKRGAIFLPGQQVRLVGSPYAGAVGTLEGINAQPAILPSGVRAPVGILRMENGEKKVMPLSNMEVIA